MGLRSAAGILAVEILLGAGSAAHAQSGGDPTACGVESTQQWAMHNGNKISVREYAGAEPPIVLMHGFPDNHHLYDRVVPYLCNRHIVLFEFLGWGDSDKPKVAEKPEDPNYYTFDDQVGQLNDVITQRGLVKPVLAGHDISGPAAINWALDHPDNIGGIVLSNTFYNLTQYNSMPEIIGIFGDLFEVKWASVTFPIPLIPAQSWTFKNLTQAMAADPDVFRGLVKWQMGTFFRDDALRQAFFPILYAQFAASPSTIPGFLALNSDLVNVFRSNIASALAGRLNALDHIVRLVWGDQDRYFDVNEAQALHAIIPNSELILVKGAYHYLQMDEPAAVAGLLLTAPHR